MTPTNSYLAVFTGSKTSRARAAWEALTEPQRRAREQEGIAAWKTWVERHRGVILTMGGPLGKTKRVGVDGIDDTTNQLAAFTVVHAESHEAAARMFENHPHFSIFPGDAIEVMPILQIPGR